MKLILLFFLKILLFVKPSKHQDTPKAGVCGYASCPTLNLNDLNIHLVPHSHDDVGWKKTVDQYYFGDRMNIHKGTVRSTIDSVVEALSRNPQRKFIQVETAYFWKWWRDQTDLRKNQFKTFVENGQLEIVGGAWSMNDEAASNYQSIIDQFTWGLGIINDTLGECGRPRIGWQIDPFGHSNEMASIFRYLGYDAFIFSRLDYRDESTRRRTNTMEMLWEGSKSRGTDSRIFTHVMYSGYGAPPGFCYDIRCWDQPIVDDLESPDYNYESRVKAFASFVTLQSLYYKTNNVLITMGGDFQYESALHNFKNMDLLVEGFELFPQFDLQGRRIRVHYSTPSCLIKGVNEYVNATSLPLSIRKEDFFPYASDPHACWTGYFTSRPTSKRLERQGNNFLQISKQLIVASKENATIYEDSLTQLREAMGVMQHHDAITGTEQQHVARDYARLIDRGITNAGSHLNSIISKLLDPTGIEDLHLTPCILSNISYCEASEKSRFTVVVYNPQSHFVTQYIRIPVNSQNFTITGPTLQTESYQVVPAIDAFSYTSITAAKFDLVILAKNIPPLGISKYAIVDNAFGFEAPPIEPATGPDMFVLGDAVTGATIDPFTGKLATVSLNGQVNVSVAQDFSYYLANPGDNSDATKRASGAYIFKPIDQNPIFATNVANATVYKGALVDVVHQTFNSWIKQVIRVYKAERYIEFDWLVGPIDINDEIGKEVITSYTTNLNAAEFLTDSNAREMVPRKPNFHISYNYTDEEPTAGNYYPVNSRIVLSDPAQGIEVAVINDRSQGATSLNLQQIDIMLHRRLLYDDAKGVNEALNEEEYGRGLTARGQHYLTVASTINNEAKFITKEIAQRKFMEPWVFVGDASIARQDTKAVTQWSALAAPLPDGVQILTLEPWKNANNIIIRLEHYYELSEYPNNITVNLTGLFTTFDIIALRETTLAANQWIENNVRLEWIADELITNQEQLENSENTSFEQFADSIITLLPMQFRTYIATIQYK